MKVYDTLEVLYHEVLRVPCFRSANYLQKAEPLETGIVVRATIPLQVA